MINPTVEKAPEANVAMQVVFDVLVDGVFKKAISDRLSDRCLARLRVAGLDLSKPLLPAYERRVWDNLLIIAAEEAFVGVERNEALRQLGSLTVHKLTDGFIAKAVSQMARLLGPKRTISKIQQNFRYSNNYTIAKPTEISPTCYDVWMNENTAGRPFMQGGLGAALDVVCGIKTNVVVHAEDAQGCTFRITW